MASGLKWFGDLAESCLGRKCRWSLQREHADADHEREIFLKNSSSARVDGPVNNSDELHIDNIVANPNFSEDTAGWVGVGCSLGIGTLDDKTFCIASPRGKNWHGLAQEIGKRLDAGVEYRLEAWVSIRCGRSCTAPIQVTINSAPAIGRASETILVCRETVTNGQWNLLTGTLRLGYRPEKATVCFGGPVGGVDILVSSVAIVQCSAKADLSVGHSDEPNNALTVGANSDGRAADPLALQDPTFEVNIVENSELNDGLQSWYSMGSCTLVVVPGAPKVLGDSTRQSFYYSPAPILSGKFIRASNRTRVWEGPAQDITDRVQTFRTYQVFAWVATASPEGSTDTSPAQPVNLALAVDGEWVNGGEVIAGSEWTELSSSFRLEQQPEKVVVYVQGPAPGVDVMLSALQIFAVDGLARVPLLQQQTDQVRKREVILTLRDSSGSSIPAGTGVRIQQTKNTFPLGSAINHTSLHDEVYTKFFLEHFNWAVFDYELKWDQVEAVEGVLKYENADYMVQFCQSNGIPMRGHCIIWEHWIQNWVAELTGEALLGAVQARVTGLLARYQGVFRHYDVNNEILHGSFYEDRLGADFSARIFALAHQCDPEPALFVNDYHIADGGDGNSTPEKYVDLIKFLEANGAPVGGIGVQGHTHAPVGPIICRALDVLGKLGISIWLTEVDVVSVDDEVRANDLEIVLREAFAHPAVEGCMLWGFMENAMSSENAYLVKADGVTSAAGQRLLALKDEWTSSLEAVVGDDGQVSFRGFQGEYTISFTQESDYRAGFQVAGGGGDGFARLDVSMA